MHNRTEQIFCQMKVYIIVEVCSYELLVI